jgi:CheY-like chemotaxis protein
MISTMTQGRNSDALRICVVENDYDSRHMLTMLLNGSGYRVEAIASMGEALDHLCKAPCDVLISDIGLPDGSGWELMTRLQQTGAARSIYAIAMSGYGMSSDLEKSRAAGFRHHLIKPMDIDQLDRLLLEATREIRASQR